MRKRVAVVGGGPSGLTTVKELIAEGHDPTLFERATGLGGIFRFDERNGSVWESCRLTSSGLVTAFSDFPVPSGQRGHMTIAEYGEYLKAYCEAFGVLKHAQFGATVHEVKRDGEGWRVTISHGDGGCREERFDAVAVCSGVHHTPHRPRFDGQDTFAGEILHATQYRRPSQVAGRRVLIVGAGESGADVTAEIAEHASETFLSLRRGVAVLPRLRRGVPNDYQTSRINNSAAHWVFQTQNPEDNRKRLAYYLVFFPFALLDKAVRVAAAPLEWMGPFRHLLPRGGGLAAARLALRTRRISSTLLAASGGILTEQFGTKSDDFVKAIARGRCTLVGPIERFEGRTVRLAGGQTIRPDLVVLCTGFETRIPFLDASVAASPRYLHTFVSSVGPSLAFIGLLRPAYGAIPPMAELQARWFARLLSGESELASAPAMEASIDRRARQREHVFRAIRGRLDYLVDYTSTCDELASLIGCKPTRAALRRESARFRLRFYASPFVAAQYRLVGPHARPDLTREVIEHLPIASRTDALASYYMRWRLSCLLARMLGPAYSPNLALE